MAAKGLDELVDELKDDTSEEDEIYYAVPEEKPDKRVGKMERVDENGKKWDGRTRQTDAARMLKAEEGATAAREKVYEQRQQRHDKFRKKLVKAEKAIDEMKYEAPDLGDISELRNVASKNVALLAALEEGKDRTDPFLGERIIDAKFADYKGLRDAYQRIMLRHAKKGQNPNLVKEGITIGSNILYNLIPFKGSLTNAKTKRFLKKNKGKQKVVFLKPGMYQSRGAIAKLGDQFREHGYVPVVLSGKHLKHKDLEKNARETMKEIEKFYKQTGTKPSDFEDAIYIGHSSGAHVGRAMSVQDDIKKLGIKRVYQVAPSTAGNQKLNKLQKALGFLARNEDPKYLQTKKNLLHYEKKPNVDTYVVSGKHDALVTPADAIDPHAKRHYLLESGAATHFGTAGTHRPTNTDLIDLVKYHHKDDTHNKLKSGKPSNYRSVRDK
jgi:hypothetical protein